MKEQELQLLSDDQVRRFIADGFIIVDSDLAPSFHAKVAEQIAYALEHELPHPGDNIVPRVPALNLVCESPVVKGALSSLLGNQFIFLPHRFPHNSEPLAATAKSTAVDDAALAKENNGAQAIEAFDAHPKMAKGSISASAWHQDSHASCGRTRWHTLRAANVFYFPHETPLHMGPTRFLAGSHLYATLHDLSSEQAVMQVIPAGSVVIAHFDLVHAGSPNNSDLGRYMMKFVALRTESPSVATWANQDAHWRTPSDLLTHHDLPVVWRSLWNWLRGAQRSDGDSSVRRTTDDVANLIEQMMSSSQQKRLSGLYELAAIGAPAVDALVDVLLASAGKDRHQKSVGKGHSGASADHLDRFFLEGQFTPEDAAIALGAIGRPAVTALVELLKHEDPWIRINAAYALGDAGAVAIGTHVDRVGELLDDSEPSVIRVTLDALCALGKFGPESVQRMRSFLARDVSGWRDSIDTEPRLAMLEQMRYLSAIALLSRLSNSSPLESELIAMVEEALIESLSDESGYPPLIACAALERSSYVASLRAAVHYLRGRAWDPAQNTRQIGAWTIAHRRSTLERIMALDEQ